MKPFFTLCLLLAINAKPMAQRSGNSFTLQGTVNTDTGRVFLIPSVDSSYYPGKVPAAGYESPVSHGHFKFSLPCSYPYMFLVGIKINSVLKYISDYMMIDPGVQSIVCNIDSLREMPKLRNRSITELTGPYSKAFGDLTGRFNSLYSWHDSLRAIYAKNVPSIYQDRFEEQITTLRSERKTTLLNYARQHPASFVALWEIANQLINGYDNALDSAYNYLSPSLQGTTTGIALKTALTRLRTGSVGASFPSLQLATIDRQKTDLHMEHNKMKYTLIDFWFSHCNPCISQFEDMKRVYREYNTKGFEIIGISTDDEKEVGNWKKVIKDYQLPWIQYLDLAGTQAYKLSIVAYPSNFLCDSNGRIVMIMVGPAQLAAFLKQHL
jgi:peroxiredoxin